MEALTRLKQSSNVVVYKNQFEALSNRITSLSETQKLSCFLSGLKDEIHLPVRMLAPKSLNEAFGLAKIQEEYLISCMKSLKTSFDPSKPSLLGVPKIENKSEQKVRLPLQRLTSAQMEERRKQGLRYNCDEKWQTGHKCKGEKLLLLEGSAFEVEHAHGLLLVELDDNGDVVIELEEQGDKAEITLYALVGNPSPNTMRVEQN